MMIKLNIVIPAYNEAHRLPQTLDSLRSYLETRRQLFQLEKLIIVNDGSTDETRALIEREQKSWPAILPLSLAKNSGKGKAVREGLKLSLQKTPAVPWILMADADGATEWTALEKALLLIEQEPDLFLVMGSRQHADSVLTPRQTFFRESLGKCFNFILRALTGLNYKDTQCGFKLFAANSDLLKMLGELSVDRFAWDAEVILWAAAFKLKIKEIPVRWAHREESHVHVVYDSIEMLYSTLRMKRLMTRRINKN